MPSSVISQAIACFVLMGSLIPAAAQTALPLAELPTPPQDLKRLMEAGLVTFEFGGAKADAPARERDSNAQAAASGLPAGPDLDPQQSFAAETHFRIEFNYEAQITWRVIAASQEIRISAKLSRFDWQPVHTVWFRDRPATESFWSNPLVLHEFDHIRLSADPRMRVRFDELMKKRFVIRHTLKPGEVATHQLADHVVQAHLEDMHQDVTELIRIRYRELDRETSHGMQPIGQGSSLYEVLREVAP